MELIFSCFSFFYSFKKSIILKDDIPSDPCLQCFFKDFFVIWELTPHLFLTNECQKKTLILAKGKKTSNKLIIRKHVHQSINRVM